MKTADLKNVNFSTVCTRLWRLFLIVTNACDSRCGICSYWRTRQHHFIPEGVIRHSVVPIVKHFAPRVVCITGGEPTLHPALPSILRLLHEQGPHLTVITNGIHLSAKLDEVGTWIDSYMISLDAADRSTYTHLRGQDAFDEVIRLPDIIKTRYSKVSIALSCVLQKGNLHYIMDLYRIAKRLPVDALFFRVPDISRTAFGRKGKLQQTVWESVLLKPEETALLRKNLLCIKKMDFSRRIVHQSATTLEQLVDYFEALYGHRSPLEDPPLCPVPFTSAVIDEHGKIGACFYLSTGMVPASGSPDGIINSPPLRRIRRHLMVPEYRQAHCRTCLQFLST